MPELRATRCGTPVAAGQDMNAGKRLDGLAMPCPACGQALVPPLADSTLTIAWYVCACGHFWSARIRDGRPVDGAPSLLPLPRTTP